jgi:hypothetical protein
MRIVVLGMASDDVDTELRKTQLLFGDAIGSTLAGSSLISSVQTIFFTPIVTRPGIGPFPDKISYLRSEPAVNLAINISHEQWIEGDQIKHVNMLAEALLRGIGQIKGSKLDQDTKTRLREIVEHTRKSLISGVSGC